MAKAKVPDKALSNVFSRAHYLATQMIFQANHRKDKAKGDPKVGGHASGSSSALHILGALHLFVKKGYDHICNKPHASPADHAFNYLLDMFFNPDGSKLTQEEKDKAMLRLRAFANEEYPHSFQSYHSVFDPDQHNFFPSGTVGIPPVNAGFLALAFRFAKKHGYKVPDAHFWCVMGDAEFREGSLFEAVPDFAEREIGNLTWILDYNRQSLDGHRITNKEIMAGTDNERVERTMAANGWEVIQVRHGKVRKELFKKKDGDKFQKFLEDDLNDYELQALLLIKDPKTLKEAVMKKHKDLAGFFKPIDDETLYKAFRDFGGHDIEALVEAFEATKKSKQPSIVIVHTLKGWGLEMEAEQGNHSSLPSKKEMEELQKSQGLEGDTLFAGFDAKSDEGKFLKARGEEIYSQMQEQFKIKEENWDFFQKQIEQDGGVPDTMDINLKMASYPHTQWMLGQCAAKLTRIANTKDGTDKKPLTEDEKKWRTAGELLTTMAPDVGTSTNLNPAMDGKIFGAPVIEDLEAEFGVKDKKLPDLIPAEEGSDRFVRFEITEGNTMSCMGSYGRMRDILGIPIIPLMTVYDFFVKRALDQLFYNLYWKSSFILVGTPSGVTLSPEGAQHGWKSDIQIPNQINWEPAFCQELDWILSDAIKRHLTGDNEGRTGVIIRGVTRGIDQKMLMKYLKQQNRFKTEQQTLTRKEFPLDGGTDESTVASVDDKTIMDALKKDVLKGAYYLIDYRGYAGYSPGDNVVNIFSLGAMVTEAVEASEKLLEKGVYANVIIVTSPDLVCGNLAHETDYKFLREELGITGDLYLNPTVNGSATPGEIVTLSGRRVPCVSVHDGEPGLLDNIGSIVGVRHETLAVRKHSKCGRPVDIYGYHKIDAKAVTEACGKVLSETAMEAVRVNNNTLQQASMNQGVSGDWKQWWDQK
ncbi:MAG: pyruvate dehydrogenase [Bdellovibrionales bacterium]|nr:pyruvate dehydrogenase [Bdellovibrionales bacterium]